MPTHQKNLKDQVIVITGASSGIGLSTAKLAAKSGAKVVLASRNQTALEKAVQDITAEGGEATFVLADVANKDEVQRVADQALMKYGCIDTWVNNAGVSIYGKLTEVETSEKKRLFDVNFWGTVNGCRSAVKAMKNKGGTIINIGSVVSHRAIPLQGIYSASKHAVKAYTDTLRMELEKDKLPIAVTLVKPASINTPFTQHARNHMDEEPSLPPPVYDPRVVARAILECAVKPRRDVIVGGSGKFFQWMDNYFPRLGDKILETMLFKQQKKKPNSKTRHRDELFSASEEIGSELGDYPGHTSKSSLYTAGVLHPVATIGIGVGLAACTYFGIRFFGLERDRKRMSSIPDEQTLVEDQSDYYLRNAS